MSPLRLPLVFLLLTACPKAPTEATTPAAPAFSYPEAPEGDVVDDHYGTRVPDPFRWLEDPDAPETRTWIESENRLTYGHLDSIGFRPAWRERVTALWNYERFGTPWEEGGRYFWYRNDGLQDQSVLWTAEALDGEANVLLDPNTFSEDGTISLGSLAVSPDGAHIAYATSDGGSDWRTVTIRNIETGQDLEERIEWVKFSGIDWTKDSGGFYYSRYPEPENPLEQVNERQQLWYHVLGTPQTEDTLVYKDDAHPKRGIGGWTSEDGHILWMGVWEGTGNKNRLYYDRLDDETTDVVRLFDAFDAQYMPVEERGDRVWIKTNKDAPRERIFAINLSAPSEVTEVVPESDAVMTAANVVGDVLFCSYLVDAHTVVKRFTLDGEPLGEVSLPGIGSASGFGGDDDSTETFYSFSGYTAPTTLYRYDLASETSTIWKQPDVDFDPDAYITEQVFYASKDGTRIPMFVTRRKDVSPDGTNPTMLYGYGGFNISITPRYSSSVVAWLEQGGIYAVANLRGGGEYGEEWHEQGIKQNKQNVFDDFISAGEWLVAQGWTAPEHLAINGRSNGGLLVGAVMTQRPDLFAAAVPGVGVLDMLRYHQFTIGWAWADDYGRADDSEEMFSYLHGYSPYHNTKAGTAYPPTLILTADHDDRVVPAHSFKFAAALQRDHAGNDPVLIRIETRAGHGAGMSTQQRIAEATDMWSFVALHTGMEPVFSTRDAAPTDPSAPAEGAAP
ncbi:MAG: prolyl oligopeptidase family serine peptidase [Myxococcota bacterium]|nr:prolyl oligopeptidase family serine peptidase [Myxococcota bacterium]